MDYKAVSETVRWHAMHSGLNGAESRVMNFLATSSDYKTSAIDVSYAEISEAVGISYSGAAKAVTSLVGEKALYVVHPAIGRKRATYRVPSADELNAYFCIEEANPAYAVWDSAKNSKFYELEGKHSAIGAGCEDCTDEELCSMHAYQEKMFEQKIEWRDRALWIANNPKPPMSRTTIHGKPVNAKR